MIIPMRCYTCNKHIGNLWEPYIDLINDKKNNSTFKEKNIDIDYIDPNNNDIHKSIEGEILDNLNLKRYCCRRMMISNVHIISNL